MMPNEKNTKRVILALDQAYEKFIQLEDKSTDEAEIVSYRCLYTNIYESKLYVEQMQKEIDRLNELLKAQQPIRPTSYCVLDKNGRTSLRWKCGRCGRLIKYNKGVIKGKDYESIDFYCGNCGTPILWNNKNYSF